MENLPPNLRADIDAISSIDAVPSILEVICRTTGMGFTAIARVTEQHWIACAVRDEIQFGLATGEELNIETTICNEIRQHHSIVAIDDVTADEKMSSHPTPALYGFRSYISVPITLKTGHFFGTLCAVDPKPAQVNNSHVKEMFRLFAEMIALYMDNMEQNERSNALLLDERKTAELREQFIAVLGHDLRNPIGAISNVAELMLRMPLDAKLKKLAGILTDASFRVKGLIDNMLDFAQGRLGNGIELTLNHDEPVEKICANVIKELNLVWPERTINLNVNLTKPVHLDGKRLAQLCSNLLSNALYHGAKEHPVDLTLRSENDLFVLSVSNFGDQIPPKAIKMLFQPFSRGEVNPGNKGLGLGLYIAAEIAKAHGGELTVESNSSLTNFTFTMPISNLPVS